MIDPVSGCSSGELAHGRLAAISRQLQQLHDAVLADREPEALHHYRVNLRRLRVALDQFAPAIALPGGLDAGRVARLARATGAVRDGDVLAAHLHQRLWPVLTPDQRRGCRPLRRRLRQRRRRAFTVLRQDLQAPRSRRLLQRLEDWRRQPRFTALGLQPLGPWLADWWLASASTCFLHPGWFSERAEAPELHGLRKHLKRVRYGLEPLAEPLGPQASAWLEHLRLAQGCLGELHDLEVLALLLRQHHAALDPLTARGLAVALERQRQELWLQWLAQRQLLLGQQSRRSLLALAAPADNVAENRR